MDGRGQIILLGALAVSVCLIALTMYLISIKDAGTAETSWPGDETLENLIWSQETGFKDIAGAAGSCPWGQCQGIVNAFRNGTDRLARDISGDMLVRGFAFSFEYNDTLAREYLSAHREMTLVSVGGVLVEKNGNSGLVCGCAYDVSMTDGSARYRLSRVACWG